jgi:large subunit ribosomal protein L18
MDHSKVMNRQRQRRRFRVRKSIRGDAGRPRLTVFRSNANIYCQIIDDSTGKTLVSASSRDKALREGVGYGGNKKAAEAVGKAVAERALAAGLKQVCFDRGSYKYHGRVAAVAEAARKAGLDF